MIGKNCKVWYGIILKFWPLGMSSASELIPWFPVIVKVWESQLVSRFHVFWIVRCVYSDLLFQRLELLMKAQIKIKKLKIDLGFISRILMVLEYYFHISSCISFWKTDKLHESSKVLPESEKSNEEDY